MGRWAGGWVDAQVCGKVVGVRMSASVRRSVGVGGGCMERLDDGWGELVWCKPCRSRVKRLSPRSPLCPELSTRPYASFYFGLCDYRDAGDHFRRPSHGSSWLFTGQRKGLYQPGSLIPTIRGKRADFTYKLSVWQGYQFRLKAEY